MPSVSHSAVVIQRVQRHWHCYISGDNVIDKHKRALTCIPVEGKLNYNVCFFRVAAIVKRPCNVRVKVALNLVVNMCLISG